MKLRKSLPLKIAAIILIILLGAAAGLGGYFALDLLAEDEIYKDQYVETGPCSDSLSMDAYNVTEYFDLYTLSRTQELTVGQQNLLDSLEARIGKSSTNFVWQVLDTKGNLVLSNLGENEPSLVAVTGGPFTPYTFDQRIITTNENGETVTTQTRYNLHYGLRENLPYEDNYRKMPMNS